MLLREFDRNTHAQRCRRIVEVARTHRDDPALGELLDEVAAESNHHHLLTLLAAQAIGDQARLLAAARHPSARVRAAAARRLPLPTDDRTVADLYLDSSAHDRATLRSRLRSENRTGVTDSLCRQGFGQSEGSTSAGPLSDVERAALLPAASADTVRELLGDLADLVPSVASLTRAHPELVLDHLEGSLTDATQVVRGHWWGWAGAALPALVTHDAARILTLLENSGPGTELPDGLGSVTASLVRRHPARMAALLTGPYATGRTPRGAVNEFRRFSTTDRIRLARTERGNGRRLAALFEALPPGERAELYEGITAEAPLNAAEASELADAMPTEVRHRLGHWLVSLPRAARPEVLLDEAAALPYAEAREVVSPYLHSPVPEERSAAHRCLLLAAGADRDREIWARAVAGITELTNEQDPVRLVVADALGHVPVGVAAAGPLGPLGTFVDAVVAARDTSAGTLSLLQRHCWRAVRWAAENRRRDLVEGHLALLDRLAGPRGTLHVTDLTTLPRGAEEWVVDALLPRIVAAMKRNDHRLLLSLAEGLGQRARSQSRIQALLEQAIDGSGDHSITRAIGLWLDDPATRGDRVVTVLHRDRSTITLAPVQSVLLNVRQDLLDQCWSRRAPRGRFWRSFTRYVPRLVGRYSRMLPRQVRAYAEALNRLATDADTPIWRAADTIALLSRLPDVGTDVLQPFLDSQRIPLVEAALGGLPHTADPRAVELLLAHRGDGFARVAAYAMGAAVGFLRPVEAAAPLRVLAGPGSKVTAAKEGVRLLGTVRPPGALDALLDAVGEGSHRDVRVAQARTLRAFLDDERVWSVLTERVHGSREEAWAIVETAPELLPVRHRARYATLVGAAVIAWPQLISGSGVWVRWQPDLAELLAAQVIDSESGWWRACVAALAAAVAEGAGWSATLRTAGELAARALDGDQPNAEPTEDLPLLQRLRELCDRLLAIADDDLRPHWAELADTLLPHASGRRLALDAAAAAVHPDDPAAGVRRLLALVPDPQAAADAAAAVGNAGQLRRCASAGLGEAVDAAAGDDVASGLVAVQLVRIGGLETSWSQEWRARLRVLRGHPVPAVAEAARSVMTARD